jgi:hypothetical protein
MVRGSLHLRVLNFVCPEKALRIASISIGSVSMKVIVMTCVAKKLVGLVAFRSVMGRYKQCTSGALVILMLR